MPELAEVEFYRRQWDAGLGEKILSVKLHAEKRIFRGTDTKGIERLLPGSKLLRSEANGKQMLFQFSKALWLGLHLGMTGKLSIANLPYVPEKHDHLVLYQKGRALVFNDMRQFGRVRFHERAEAPDWWEGLPPGPLSSEFTLERMKMFLRSHPALPIKGTLLSQKGFPGVGNWMADEILWRARVDPRTLTKQISSKKLERLWVELQFVCKEAIKYVGEGLDNVPADWLFHERWKRKAVCPIHRAGLQKETVAGRTTAWCDRCQK